MQFIQGKNRTQSILFPKSLDQIIEQDNEVRIIDLFVESINLTNFHFEIKTSKEGRPAYHPKDLLKLFVYGYLNHIRSSRQLEKECKRNIELLWLMKELAPDHNTIANFRRDNEKAIRKVFRYTVSIAKEFNLIGGKLVAGDSTKLRAQNSKKNNFNEGKIERHLEYIDAKHNIPIDYKVTNENDSRALSGMLRRTKTILGTKDFTALYDKGYHTGLEIKKAVALDINIMVAIPGTSSNAPDENYNMDRFT